MQHKLSVLESDLENAEAKLSEAKVGKEEGESHKSNVDILQRRIAVSYTHLTLPTNREV